MDCAAALYRRQHCRHVCRHGKLIHRRPAITKTIAEKAATGAQINGQSAELADATRAAVEWLQAARRPLVCGFGQVATGAQRIAVGLADRLGGVADWTESRADAAPVLAFQQVGAVAASYGEIVDRADLIVRWSCELEEQLPGSLDTIDTVEVGSGALPLRPGADYEAIACLRMLLADLELDEAIVEQQTGVALGALRQLYDQMIAANYVAVVRGKAVSEGGVATVAALTQVGQELHAHSRVAIVSPLGAGNKAGAENVMAWQTGFPMAVDFAAGYPRYRPDDCLASTLLERGEVDVVLTFRGDEETELVIEKLADEQTITIPIAPLKAGGGTYYRTDGIALTLPHTSSLPEAVEVLSQIEAKLLAVQAAAVAG
ncbi:MAG: hypothetical protein AAGF31_10340 [Planctomycetota bacterium]